MVNRRIVPNASAKHEVFDIVSSSEDDDLEDSAEEVLPSDGETNPDHLPQACSEVLWSGYRDWDIAFGSLLRLALASGVVVQCFMSFSLFRVEPELVDVSRVSGSVDRSAESLGLWSRFSSPFTVLEDQEFALPLSGLVLSAAEFLSLAGVVPSD